MWFKGWIILENPKLKSFLKKKIILKVRCRLEIETESTFCEWKYGERRGENNSVGKQAPSAVLEKETDGNGVYFCVLKAPSTFSGKRLHTSLGFEGCEGNRLIMTFGTTTKEIFSFPNNNWKIGQIDPSTF